MDPHIGLDQSFHTWARADGSRTLLASPYVDEPADGVGGFGGGNSSGCPMEAYRPIFEDAGWTQAGTFEWTIHSAGWATEWARQTQAPIRGFQDPTAPWPHPKSPWPSWHLDETVSPPDPSHARQWHAPSSLVLMPGESKTYALRFALDDGEIEFGGLVAVEGYILNQVRRPQPSPDKVWSLSFPRAAGPPPRTRYGPCPFPPPMV